MRAILAAVLMACLTSPVLAADWTLDPEKSHLIFQGTQTGDQTFRGEFESFDAVIRFDPDALADSAARVEVDLSSAVTGDRQRDAFIAMPAWLDPKSHPRAVFETTAFRKLEDGRYAADGTLTLKGVSRPVSLPFTLAIDGDTAKVDGRLVLNRTDFGVGTGEYAEGEYVGLEVTVIVDLVATR